MAGPGRRRRTTRLDGERMPGRRFAPRTLRARLALLSALAAFFCLAVAGTVVFTAAARFLGQQSEGQLRQGMSLVAPLASGLEPTLFPQVCRAMSAARDGTGTGAQRGLAELAGLPMDEVSVSLVRPDGTSCRLLGRTDVHDVAPAAWGWRRLLGTTLPQGRGDHGERMLVLDQRLGGGWRLRAARDLTRDIKVVRELRGVTIVLSIGGGLAALVAGLAVARSGLRPVGALAETAEHIARTQDLSVRIDVPDRGERDEVTRLARAFDRMTSALSASRARQAQLVADAGHELRTPLTSLRTNIDLLLRAERSGRAIPAAQREALFEDVRSQLAELSQLASELTVLAQDEPAPVLGPVRLDEVVRAAVLRVGPRAGDRTVEVDLQPWELEQADAAGLSRAVINALDNAVKFSPAGSTIRVRLAGGTVTVDDEGPGVPAEHRTEAFARFWRGDAARSLPGSGLGLAIVADTVRRHGGSAELDAAPGGGARVRLRLPGRPVPADDADTPEHPHTGGAASVEEL